MKTCRGRRPACKRSSHHEHDVDGMMITLSNKSVQPDSSLGRDKRQADLLFCGDELIRNKPVAKPRLVSKGFLSFANRDKNLPFLAMSAVLQSFRMNLYPTNSAASL